MFASTGLIAGVLGMPFMGLFAGLYNQLGTLFQDKDERAARLREGHPRRTDNMFGELLAMRPARRRGAAVGACTRRGHERSCRLPGSRAVQQLPHRSRQARRSAEDERPELPRAGAQHSSRHRDRARRVPQGRHGEGGQRRPARLPAQRGEGVPDERVRLRARGFQRADPDPGVVVERSLPGGRIHTCRQGRRDRAPARVRRESKDHAGAHRRHAQRTCCAPWITATARRWARRSSRW
jgi:hypothetical protein